MILQCCKIGIFFLCYEFLIFILQSLANDRMTVNCAGMLKEALKMNSWLTHLNLSGKLKRYAMKSNSWLTHLNLSCKIKRYTMKSDGWLTHLNLSCKLKRYTMKSNGW